MLLKNLNNSISGYFYKRKSHYFDKKDKARINFFSGFLQKINYNSIAKYDKRFFKLDLNSFMFMYAKDEESIDKKPHYSSLFRNIISVKKNIVSMPFHDALGVLQFKEVSVFDKTYDIDAGPNEKCNNVLEIKLIDRLFTLYTHDNILMEKFTMYISKILEMKDEINVR